MVSRQFVVVNLTMILFIVNVLLVITLCLGQRLCPQQPPTNRVRFKLTVWNKCKLPSSDVTSCVYFLFIVYYFLCILRIPVNVVVQHHK